MFQRPVSAEEPSATIAKIKQSGQITLGVRESSPPFSFVESGQQSAKGYSLDICAKIIDAIAKEAKIAKLDVKQVVVTPSNRMAKLADGTIDLECGSTTNTEARAKEVSFSYTTFITGTRFLVKKSSHIQTIQDLKGKVVVSTAGTNNEKVVTKFALDNSLGFVMKSAKDHAESFSLVQSNAATAFAMDDILLAGLISKSSNPSEYEIIGNYLSIEPYGLMMRKDDKSFIKVVDNAIVGLFHSGEINKIYEKWFITSNLTFPMPSLMKEVVRTPSKEPAWPR